MRGMTANRDARWTPELRHRVLENLDVHPRATSPVAARRAAVAIVMLQGADGEAALPLFRRGARLRRHAGQMGLPGGRLDDGEEPEAAALRELQEELGIVAGHDAVLGALDDFETRSGFVITPFVVWSEAAFEDLQPAQGEIAQLYVASVREVQAAVAGAEPGTSQDFSLAFPFGEVYAPTGAMLYQFSEVALGGRLCRVQDFHQPPWTWR
jgi:8-oxo-dGTP pyrophosphatase MutT (NUDIX family)